MLQTTWTRSVEGVRPGLLLAHDRILFHYETADGQPGTRLACFDLDGRQLWSRPATTGLLALPGGRFLVTTPQREPLLLDGDGRVLGRWKRGVIVAAEGHGDRIMLAGSGRIWATDSDLNPLWDVAWPDERYPDLDCFVEDALYWVEQDEVRFISRASRVEVLSRVPADLVAEAMDRHERTTGASALLGGYFSAEAGAEYTPFRAGGRPSWFHWRVSFDPELGCFFLANTTAPHLLVCLDRAGKPRWCQYLSFGCCGGVPAALPDGRYVASSGCGGILSWLDADGNVLLQSRPHEGVGLATAYSSEVWVLPDGRVLVDGGPGVVAFSPTGERLWVFEESFLQFECDPAQGVVVGCYWRTTEPGEPNRAYLLCAGRL